MSKDDFLKANVCSDPEAVFGWPNLSYKSAEIVDIVDRFERAAAPTVAHAQVRELLTATQFFRRSTIPDGVFSKLRSQTKTDEELQDIFIQMNDAVQQAEQSVLENQNAKDQKILAAAIDYAKKSIRNRISGLSREDRLFPFWETSDLKKAIDK